MSGYSVALTDWLACAVAGMEEPTTKAASASVGADAGVRGRVAVLATAGRVLDYDDTYAPGLAHLSAATAPVALAMAADRGADLGTAMAAYEEGFEAMGSMARRSFPGLHLRGYHPTTACGVLGAAVTAAGMLGLDPGQRDNAIALALFRAGGTQSVFETDAQALGVGWAAASGVDAAMLAAAGVSVDLEAAIAGFDRVTGGEWAPPDAKPAPAIEQNWLKVYPCSRQAHGPIEAALSARSAGIEAPGEVLIRVHPVSRRAARFDSVEDRLEAKHSIPYLTAYALLRGEPDVRSFDAVDEEVNTFVKERTRLQTDNQLLEAESTLVIDQDWVGWITAPQGSPERPLTDGDRAAKVARLCDQDLDQTLGDPGADVAGILADLGLDQ